MVQRVIYPVQWLRGLAALMVVWFHACQPLGLNDPLFQPFGVSGVDIFFVISGFIMVAISGNGSQTPAAFFRDRVIRVAPLYWIVTLTIVVAAAVPPYLFDSHKPTITNTAQSLFFIPHYSSKWEGEIAPLLPLGWTLNYEMFFYLIFAISLFFRGRSTAVLLMICGVLVVCGHTWGPFTNAPLETYTDPMLFEFAAGAVIGEAYLRGFTIRYGRPALIVASLGVVLIVGGVYSDSTVGRVAQGVGAIMLVAACIQKEVGKKHSLLHVLGDASYAIYLTHFFTLMCVHKIMTRTLHGTPDRFVALMLAVLSTLVCAVVGWLVFKCIERPVTNWVRSWAGRRQPPTTAEPVESRA